VKDDGLPVDTDPRVVGLFTNRGPRQRLRLLLCPSRQCRVGHVWRIADTNVLELNCTNRIDDVGGPVKRRQRLAVLLDDPDRPVALSCEHLQSELVDLNALRSAVRATTRLGAPHILQVMS
jgi:hypothetical protein